MKAYYFVNPFSNKKKKQTNKTVARTSKTAQQVKIVKTQQLEFDS